jgi:nitroreductase
VLEVCFAMEAVMAEIGLFEAMYTARAIRRLKPDPIPDEIIAKLIEAGTRAPSGGNNQPWTFVAVTDPQLRAQIGELYRRGNRVLMQTVYKDDPGHAASHTQWLVEHLAEVPLLILICAKPWTRPGIGGTQPAETMLRSSGASIYPAVENIILACRGYGLGTVMTTGHLFYESEVKAALGIPPEVNTYAMLPIGYPQDGVRHGPVKRRPVSEVTYRDRWGNPWI